MTEWELHTPMLNPPGVAPGWYFVFKKRDGALGSYGPMATKAECAAAIATKKTCHNCKTPVFGWDDTELTAKEKRQGVRLCPDCAHDFKLWHAKERGVIPAPLGLKKRIRDSRIAKTPKK